MEHAPPSRVKEINSRFLRKKQNDEEGHFLVNGLQSLGETVYAK